MIKSAKIKAVISIIVLIALAFSACKKTPKTDETPTQQPATEPVTVEVSTKGIRGGGQSFAQAAVSLEGSYDVEFLYQPGGSLRERPILDFRTDGGTGYISQSGSELTASSGEIDVGRSRISKINNEKTVYGRKNLSDSLQLAEVRGMDINASELTFLSDYENQNIPSSFLARVRIFEHFSGVLVYEWLLDELKDGAFTESVSGAAAAAKNPAETVIEELSLPEIYESYHYRAWKISRTEKTEALITHDDGDFSIMNNIAPILNENRMVANIAVVPEWVLKKGVYFMHHPHLITLRDTYGFGIVSHGYSHIHLGNLAESDADEAHRQVFEARKWLNENGFDGDYLVYPESAGYSEKAAQIAKDAGAVMARVVSSQAKSDIQENPPTDLMAVAPIWIDNIKENLDGILYLIDKTVAERGLLVLYGHGINNDEMLEKYRIMLSRMKTLNAETMTMRHWYELHNGKENQKQAG